MYCLAVVGNGKGMIGFGEGKHAEQGTATRKAVTQAVKNMEFVHRYQDRTIYGDVDYKFHAVQLRLRSRPAGFGIRANHFIYEICRCAGITDLSAKVWGSRTGMNVVKGVFEALKEQRLPSTIAQARGRRIVDVESAYYSRQA
ncbi:ribosomal protein S5, C-terminal domain-domain-containing protein [Protomyces lactucae-debilis]|uniref:Ribosomal protein S5, C-terminal domain-domain-containing protein n=1 Tax=Protomyces lactucae-debilis TaxID=2754530 RepID=A0A1Y2FSQ1_PROLT|nr:ribosomal protein S5, C-terminal domain-containing protein [Protomyces lactucae-debilis]ORY85745.1 ribosomal protein S5, C-terminal domain-domain-containing protein [Protomyces lactucae-debilis]